MKGLIFISLLVLFVCSCSQGQRYPSSNINESNIFKSITGNDWFEREPFIAHFENQGDTFSVIGVHIKPKDAVKELNRLDDVYKHSKQMLHESNYLLMGDFNAGCKYLSKSDEQKLDLSKDKSFNWLVNSNADTNVADKQCSYDRIIAVGKISYNDPKGKIRKSGITSDISDHYLVWAKIRVGKTVLKVASWNIQNFGETKAKHSKIIEAIANVVDDYDIVFIQEIMSKSEIPMDTLMANLPDHYRYVQTKLLGRNSYKERYAYLYNSTKVKLLDSYVLED